jgi:hypothetical protein
MGGESFFEQAMGMLGGCFGAISIPWITLI